MKIFQFWLIFAVEGGRYYAKMKAQKAAAKTQMMIRDADGVSFPKNCNFQLKMGLFTTKSVHFYPYDSILNENGNFRFKMDQF